MTLIKRVTGQGVTTAVRMELADVKTRFDIDRKQWHKETCHMSSVTDMSMNAAYQRIIGLGPNAVPLIIEQLRQQPDHWFWALTAIIGEDKAAGSTTVSKAAQRWIEWFDGSD